MRNLSVLSKVEIVLSLIVGRELWWGDFTSERHAKGGRCRTGRRPLIVMVLFSLVHRRATAVRRGSLA